MSDLFNPDDFIAGIRTAQTKVTIFQRADLAGELLAVENDLALFAPPKEGEPQEDRDLTAGSEKAELLEKQERLQAELSGSAVEFTIRALDQDAVEAIAKVARKACKDRADEKAKEARGYAREECKRGEVTDPKEINEQVRRAASHASSEVIRQEAGIHILANVIVSDAGQPVFTVDQMRSVVEKIGQPQVEKLQSAFYDLTSTDPGAFIPKSLTPGRTDEG